MNFTAQRAIFPILGAVLVVFLVAPVAALIISSPPSEVVAGLAHPLVWPALELSLSTTLVALLLIVLFGTPLAWTLARSQRRGARLLETALQLPVVIPPAVAGVALLLAFGRRGLFTPEGVSVSGSTVAVVMAEVFVAAPFYIQAAINAFRAVDERLIAVARTFGASPLRIFLRVAVPLAVPGLVAGAAMCWARALGEFGATLMFAGNLEATTQTMPLAIYTAFESDLSAAQALAIVLVVVAFALLMVVRLSQRPR